ncbi:MAG: hypothetical protein FWD17_11675 [Polyangiaceae bacterium]|nr:hypothetical protein [Polyangiaceae bacterium]
MFDYPSLPPKPHREGILRLGTAVGLGAGAALACVLPATLRVAAVSPEGGPRVWITLGAAALLPMIGAVVVLRGARDGLRAFGLHAEAEGDWTPRSEAAERRAIGIALWLATLLILLSVFGGLLRATTHHHALAGVTYAIGALFLAIASALGCARIVAILDAASEGTRRVASGTLAVVTAAALAWVAVRFLRAATVDEASASAASVVVDILAFSLAAGFAARPSFAGRRALALVGPPVAITVLVLGLITIYGGTLRTAIDDRAPAYSAIVDLLP